MFVDSWLVTGVKKDKFNFVVGDLKYGIGVGTNHYMENRAVRVSCVLIGRLFLFSEA